MARRRPAPDRDDARAQARALGRYYTPPALVDAVLDGALGPLRVAGARPRVLDPACGDGRFLVAAARSIARMQADTGDGAVLREVIRGCVYGVDRDADAVAAARATLAEAGGIAPDDPALLAHLRVGDALLGADPGAPSAGSDADDADTVAQIDGVASADPSARAAALGVLHWRWAFPAVFADGGFDAVIGNPPWIAHGGRAAQPLAPGIRAYYRARYAAFAGYPTTHGAFVQRAASLLRTGGRLGLVVPASVLELHGYAPTRAAHDALCEVDPALPDFGEGRFEGVTQPCAALLSTRRTDPARAVRGAPWACARDDLDAVARGLLARVETLSRLPPSLFGDRGLQSSPSMRARFRCEADGEALPLREGRDIEAFRLGPPRIHVPRDALLGATRSAEGVAVLIRQTARFPGAARADGAWFRNSVLAGFEGPGWPADLLVALLNASFVRWLHHARFRDARQPVLPQLKIGHLRAIPAPPHLDGPRRGAILALSAELSARDAGIDSRARARLDALIADAYGLDAAERARVETWRRTMGAPEPVGRRRRAQP